MNKVGVVGAGTMGNGIAHTFAQFGFEVILADANAEALKKGFENISRNMDRQVSKGILSETDKQAALARIEMVQGITEAFSACDLVVEAASENLQVKMAIFKSLDTYCNPNCILTSNTSSISITKIASATARPEKVIGMHFMNPVPVMKLVEIINGFSTSKETLERVIDYTKKIGKIPVNANDYPGFVANRILMPMINEAIISLQEGVAGVAEIDNIMKLGMAHPMGPLQLADFIGLDICLNILNVLFDGFGQPKYAPSPLLVNMVNAGKLGIKTGSGFYDYSQGTKELIVAPAFR
ncbi:MAG: 3-hydroxybutyryl-CoA dehydrogenase [Bacteroidia bacterium]|jgi:3-hydroxybutyryl-CoA dehydrogenase|nr:3-hydroxybutyryl-CoA dehydrogenase [Bacteroidia bacterium]